MTLNKQTGNMYGWIDYTWNPIRGKCPHQCSYCYMKMFKVGELRLDEKALKDNLGEGRTIFVGSSIDMWAKGVYTNWIHEVIEHCNKYSNNTYLFQSKNVHRLYRFRKRLPPKTILGTTIETNRDYGMSNAPVPFERMVEMHTIAYMEGMVSIEPIMDFDLNILVDWMELIMPKFVSIGADSQGHNLPEPSPEKVRMLIQELKKFTEVKIKPNLKRIVGDYGR